MSAYVVSQDPNHLVSVGDEVRQVSIVPVWVLRNDRTQTFCIPFCAGILLPIATGATGLDSSG